MTRKEFYQSKIWKQQRYYIWLKQHCLCARCSRAVYVDGLSKWIPKDKRLKGVVHHKIYLDNNNIYDISVSLNEDNLEGLCIDCHNKEHFNLLATREDVLFDEDGNLIPKR